MAYINTFKITNNATQLEVALTANAGETFNQVLLWTEETFKDYSQAINFSSKLSGVGEEESFIITAAEIEETVLDGIYFIEVTDTSIPGSSCESCQNTALGVATDFARFSYCITEYLCGMDINCADSRLLKAITMKMYIDGLRNSLQLGNFITAIKFWNNLDRACSNSCTTCTNKLSELAKKGLGFQTLGNEIILV